MRWLGSAKQELPSALSRLLVVERTTRRFAEPPIKFVKIHDVGGAAKEPVGRDCEVVHGTQDAPTCCPIKAHPLHLADFLSDDGGRHTDAAEELRKGLHQALRKPREVLGRHHHAEQGPFVRAEYEAVVADIQAVGVPVTQGGGGRRRGTVAWFGKGAEASEEWLRAAERVHVVVALPNESRMSCGAAPAGASGTQASPQDRLRTT